ncbi:MAG TPA: cytochrome C oxidase subunit IV family protein [bacterium]|nr:cytochrome C oxidase subunit IV family protein [bacterium]
MSDSQAGHGAMEHGEAEEFHAQPLPEGVTRVYMVGFAVLLLLTLIEASTVLAWHLPPAVRVTILIITASIKASMIAAYYMNLKFERVAMVGIAVSPLLLAVLMFFMIAPDAAQRFGAR